MPVAKPVSAPKPKALPPAKARTKKLLVENIAHLSLNTFSEKYSAHVRKPKAAKARKKLPEKSAGGERSPVRRAEPADSPRKRKPVKDTRDRTEYMRSYMAKKRAAAKKAAKGHA